MNNDEQYVPDEEQVRAWCREGTGDYPDVMDEWLDRFLARVRRDAARQAEAERDYRRRENAELRDELVATQEYGAKLAHGKDEAEERIEAVQALHSGTRWPGVTDKPICDACDQPWPCPTIRALDGDA